MLQHDRERMVPSLEMNSLTQVIYKRGLAFTYLNFKNLELLSLLYFLNSSVSSVSSVVKIYAS